MLCGVLVLGRVAAPHMSAFTTEPEMYPGVARRQAFLATIGRSRGYVLDLVEVIAFCCHDSLSLLDILDPRSLFPGALAGRVPRQPWPGPSIIPYDAILARLSQPARSEMHCFSEASVTVSQDVLTAREVASMKLLEKGDMAISVGLATALLRQACREAFHVCGMDLPNLVDQLKYPGNARSA